MRGLVVVGVDGSEGSRRALRWAAGEAQAHGFALRVVGVWSYLDQPAGEFDPAYGEDDARRAVDEAVESLRPDAKGADIERLVVCDLPARGLITASQGADLLVVGSRGLGGFKGLLLGSVSQQVAQYAPCPVVIVPGREGERT